MRIKLLYLIAFVVILIGSSSIVAQQTDAEFDVMQRAQMIAEIKNLRAQNAAKDTIISEQKNTIEVYKKLDGVNEARIGDLKEALKNSKEAGGLDIKIENMYKLQVSEFKDENARLRKENDGLRKSRDRRSLVFGMIGLAAGAFIW